MTTEVDTRRPDESREDQLRQLLAQGKEVESKTTDDGSAQLPAGLAARLADGSLNASNAVSQRTAAVLSLQRSHGNAYVQRLVESHAPSRPALAAAKPRAPLPMLQLQTEDEEPLTSEMPSEPNASFAPPDAPPVEPPPSPPMSGGGTSGGGPPMSGGDGTSGGGPPMSGGGSSPLDDSIPGVPAPPNMTPAAPSGPNLTPDPAPDPNLTPGPEPEPNMTPGPVAAALEAAVPARPAAVPAAAVLEVAVRARRTAVPVPAAPARTRRPPRRPRRRTRRAVSTGMGSSVSSRTR